MVAVENGIDCDLAGMAWRFARDGFAFLVTGETACRWYQRREPAVLQIWTNADLLYAARQFDDLDVAEGGDWSAVARLGERSLRLSCDPLLAGRRGVLPPRELRRVAARQPFTVETLLYDPARDRFLDPLGSLPDIRARVLRLTAPAESLAAGGPELVLRAIFLECEEQFIPDPSLWAGLPSAWALGPESRDRIRAGLEPVLTSRNPYLGVQRLDETGLLGAIFPELADLKGCPQDKDFHPEGDVFVHTHECFRRLHRLPLGLALGVLLHDIGKPVTLTVDRNLHFPGHSTAGAVMAVAALRRLGYRGELLREVAYYIRNHLLWRLVNRMPEDELAAFVRHPWFENLFRLYLADIYGSMGDSSSFRQVRRRVDPYRASGVIRQTQ